MLLIVLMVLGIAWLMALVVVAGVCISAAHGDRALAASSGHEDDVLASLRLRLIA